MGHGYPHGGFSEGIVVPVGRSAFRKLGELAAGGSAVLDADEAQAIVEEVEILEQKIAALEQRSARLYRAGVCPKCGSDNTNRLQNGDGECYPCGLVYEFSENT